MESLRRVSVIGVFLSILVLFVSGFIAELLTLPVKQQVMRGLAGRTSVSEMVVQVYLGGGVLGILALLSRLVLGPLIAGCILAKLAKEHARFNTIIVLTVQLLFSLSLFGFMVSQIPELFRWDDVVVSIAFVLALWPAMEAGIRICTRSGPASQ